MNFNYSYRAFVITCLLVGNLILLLVSVKLGSKKAKVEEVMAVEYTEILPEELVEQPSSQRIKIKTNTAYNEAEEFIRELENSRNLTTPPSQEELSTNSETTVSSSDFALGEAQQQLNSVKNRLAKKATVTKEKEGTSVNKKTTIRYQLKDRKQLRLPNPVYTCDRGGIVVINIEVSALGKVIKTSYNKVASTTTNGCLIESALAYATKARFTTKAGLPKQLGTITYSFPGQH